MSSLRPLAVLALLLASLLVATPARAAAAVPPDEALEPEAACGAGLRAWAGCSVEGDEASMSMPLPYEAACDDGVLAEAHAVAPPLPPAARLALLPAGLALLYACHPAWAAVSTTGHAGVCTQDIPVSYCGIGPLSWGFQRL